MTVGNSSSETRPTRWSAKLRIAALCALFVCAGWAKTEAALQFDVFLGYDGVVPEASWFPVVCEVKNDGPSFNGTVEVQAGNFGEGQTRRVEVELPTGTLKRIVIPVFSPTRGYSSWDVRLLDERGKVRAEQTGLRARKQTAARTPIIGALSRTAGGTPTIRPILSQQSELQPTAARLLPSIFPDNPLVLEGMDCLYLNTERALDLRSTQVEALLGWLNAGGHLIVGIEQVTDVAGTPWLRDLLPFEIKEIRPIAHHPEIQDWLRTTSAPSGPAWLGNQMRPQGRNTTRSTPRPGVTPETPFSDLSDDLSFETAELQVATGALRDGRVILTVDGTPLIVTADRGRGKITLLLFSPEREPFRSWKNLPTFWARMAEVPGTFYVSTDFYQQGGWSADGIFGAMVDTQQVHKLPLGWLLLLLVVYLVVIGPLDQFWLRKIGRPMLTWITFPCYVVLFSLLIYFIGYKLRAGESEWNELHLVDVLFNGDRAQLRGRTYASVYSPSNQRYQLRSQQKFATLRGEFASTWAGGVQSTERATIEQEGDSFRAEIFVPVWTSQLFVSDWWQPAALPLHVVIEPQGGGWKVTAENRTDRPLREAQLVLGGYVMSLGELPPHETRTVSVTKERGTLLRDYVWRYGQGFQNVVASRQRAFGGNQGRIEDLPNSAIAASFLSQMSHQQNYMNSFIATPGLDLSPAIERGEAIVLAWADDYSPVKPMNLFSPRRSHRYTLWRVAVEVKSDKPAAVGQPEA